VYPIVPSKVKVFQDMFNPMVMNFGRADTQLCTSNNGIQKVGSTRDQGIDELPKTETVGKTHQLTELGLGFHIGIAGSSKKCLYQASCPGKGVGWPEGTLNDSIHVERCFSKILSIYVMHESLT
jgi:hypothetical protein